MGWARGIEKGRLVGYAVIAECDHGGCCAKIDRGISYRCGGMRNVNEDYGCGGFFCHAHKPDERCLTCIRMHPDPDEDE